jgi:hypothetical protein
MKRKIGLEPGMGFSAGEVASLWDYIFLVVLFEPSVDKYKGITPLYPYLISGKLFFYRENPFFTPCQSLPAGHGP